MTKEQARRILIHYILVGVAKEMEPLPITDEVVYTKDTKEGFEQWTFKGLIKIAYDL